MFALAVLVSLFAVIFSHGTAMETVSGNVNSSCSYTETECALGCCPFVDATCCADGFECCPHGKTCIPFIGICLGLEEESGKTSLFSTKSTPVKSSITVCPSGTTSCGGDKCCLLPYATCCEDGEHCCPQGYRCDAKGKKCIKNSVNDVFDPFNTEDTSTTLSPIKTSKKSFYKSCPGSSRICPSYASCCIRDNGEWGCCPNPSLPQLKYGGGECCDTIFGHMCCPDDFPHCTVIGCMK